jgi:hypothetical protein
MSRLAKPNPAVHTGPGDSCADCAKFLRREVDTALRQDDGYFQISTTKALHIAGLLDKVKATSSGLDLKRCRAYQASDQMACPCGLGWDVNDSEPPICPNTGQPGTVSGGAR